MRQRLGELEERVDFAERLLAKQREGERLYPRPKSPEDALMREQTENGSPSGPRRQLRRAGGG